MHPKQKVWSTRSETNLMCTQIHTHCPSQSRITALIATCSGTNLEVINAEELIFIIGKCLLKHLLKSFLWLIYANLIKKWLTQARRSCGNDSVRQRTSDRMDLLLKSDMQQVSEPECTSPKTWSQEQGDISGWPSGLLGSLAHLDLTTDTSLNSNIHECAGNEREKNILSLQGYLQLRQKHSEMAAGPYRPQPLVYFFSSSTAQLSHLASILQPWQAVQIVPVS